MVPEFREQGVKIAANEAEAKKMAEAGEADGGGGGGGGGLVDVDEQCAHILGELPAPAELAGYRMTPVDFEDDDFHRT